MAIDATPDTVPPARHARVRSGTLPARERRTVTKLVRLSPAEARRIERRALECGRPVACFLREAALGAAPRARRTAGIDPVIAELVRLGTELRQLRDANATEPSAAAVRGTIDGAIDGALGAVLDTIRRLGQGADDTSNDTADAT